MLAPYQKYSHTNSNKWFVSHLYGIHNGYQEMRSYQHGEPRVIEQEQEYIEYPCYRKLADRHKA